MIAITGGSGQLGQAVAAALSARVPPSGIRLGTRRPSELQAQVQRGVEVVYADFDEPTSLEQLFDRADTALLICGTASNEVRIRQHQNVISAAKWAGLSRLVYTSFVNPVPTSLFPYSEVHARTEVLLRASGLHYVLLRNNHYFENLRFALGAAYETGMLALPGAAGKVAYISRQDLGEATAAILADTSVKDVELELTGSQAVTLYEVAEEASKVWGRKIQAYEMPPDEYRLILQARGLPDYAVEAQIGIRLAAGAGEHARVTQDAEQLIKRPLKNIQDYLATFALSF